MLTNLGDELVTLKISVRGTVQGVGFRPFVYTLASSLHLTGSVQNAGGTVAIDVSGAASILEQFLVRLQAECPELAKIDSLNVLSRSVAEGNRPFGFKILDSIHAGGNFNQVPPDIATCRTCLQDVTDPENRRYEYPFTNCTNCGPRFTIIESLPYDRASTTMRHFPMCVKCLAEYADPADRRFHAQPNACWSCGPQLSYVSHAEPQSGEALRAAEESSNQQLSMECLENVVRDLGEGKIVAIKGLGGFHLSCNSWDQDAVLNLRKRKHRSAKPFAVMARDIEAVKELFWTNQEELDLIAGPKKPIVLLKPKLGAQVLARNVSGETERVGVMLPYTALHMMLLRRVAYPLVMTSGNLSEEPICMENAEAQLRLRGIADSFLLHNRDIQTRFDDSVVQFIDTTNVILRRSRGYAPAPIKLPLAAERTVLGVGASLKNTFCLASDNRAFVSQHIGDLQSIESLEFWHQVLGTYQSLFNLRPEILACDLHPDYLSTSVALELARDLNLPLVPVQHHHAHIASCMAEHGLTSSVIGVAFDGTGYGIDGSSWGGEVLVADYGDFKRVGTLLPVPMPGGELAIRKPWRMALGYLSSLTGRADAALCSFADGYFDRLDPAELKVARFQLERSINSPVTSSCGRLFDAVSSLLGICDQASYEGQAAMMLETKAAEAISANLSDSWTLSHVLLTRSHPGLAATVFNQTPELLMALDTPAMIQELVTVAKSGMDTRALALEFHRAVARVIVDMCCRASEEYQINTICLSGGVFQNRLLTAMTVKQLQTRELNVYIQNSIPTNDGGLSLGQAMVALAKSNCLAPLGGN